MPCYCAASEYNPAACRCPDSHPLAGEDFEAAIAIRLDDDGAASLDIVSETLTIEATPEEMAVLRAMIERAVERRALWLTGGRHDR